MSTTLREGTPDDVGILAAMFRRMWLDNGVDEADIVHDWGARVREFVERGRAHDGLRFVVAERAGIAIGCAACQRFAGLYPDLLAPSLRRYGYVWGVYVDADHRREGLGEQLTEWCVAALRDDACTHVILHAAPMGRGIYERLGFEPSNEMRLVLG